MVLKRLADLGLPPTPQNHAKFYNDIAGITQTAGKPDATSSDLQLVAKVRHVVEDAADSTGNLADLIRNHNDGIKTSLDTLQQPQDTPEVVRLLQSIIRTASSMHHTVEDSHGNLCQLTTALHLMRDDIAASRHALEHNPLTGHKITKDWICF